MERIEVYKCKETPLDQSFELQTRFEERSVKDDPDVQTFRPKAIRRNRT